MQNNGFVRISLDERMERLKHCQMPSQAYSVWIMKNMAEMGVLGILRDFTAHDIAETLESHLSGRFRKNPREVTIGDLAVMVSEWYLKGDDLMPEISLYIASLLRCFQDEAEFSAARIQSARRKGPEYRVSVSVDDIRFASDFFAIPFGDYIQIVTESAAPPKAREWCAEFYLRSRAREYTELSKVLSRFIENERLSNSRYSIDSFMENSRPRGKDLLSDASFVAIMNLFIMPIAFMATENRSNNR